MIPKVNAALLILLAIAIFILRSEITNAPLIIIPWWLLTVILSLAIAIYRPQGFSYPLVKDFGQLYVGGEPYFLYLNASKVLGGYIICCLLLYRADISGLQKPVGYHVISVVAAIATVLLIAIAIFDVGIQFKLVDGIMFFAICNLLFTVIPEEAFYRVLVQNKLAEFLGKQKRARLIAAGLTTLIFALSHSAAIGPEFFLFVLVGSIYTAVYVATGSLLATVATHFGVNIIHFIFLEYPLKI